MSFLLEAKKPGLRKMNFDVLNIILSLQNMKIEVLHTNLNIQNTITG
ncbi:hypothetical protein N9J52_01960 [Flavobacteriales bacterium]|nr:hypothetical protein [Flavobacteriales bacterium]